MYNLYDWIEAIGFLTSSATGRTFILEPNWHIVGCSPCFLSNRESETERESERERGCLKQKVPVLTFFFFCLFIVYFYFIACASFGTSYVAKDTLAFTLSLIETPVCLYHSSSIITILVHRMVLLSRACGIQGTQTTKTLTVLRLLRPGKPLYVVREGTD